jgi:predicted MPP superfamily phosphohydrolase
MTNNHKPLCQGALWERRLELEQAREEQLSRRKRKDMLRSAPRYPEFWFEKLVNLTGLRARGEANARDFRLQEIAFAFDNLPPAFHGFRILHLTDIHFRENDPDSTDKLCRLLTGLEVDFCAFTGDYRYAFSGPYQHVLDGMQRVLDTVTATHGRAAVLGNHDLAAFVKPFRDTGLPVLMNEHFTLEREGERIWIAGVDDPHHYCCDNLPLALTGVPLDEFTILLCHTPELAVIAPSYGIDFYLCGHTHCGQVCLPGRIPIVVNARAPRKYCAHQWRNARTRGYTSPGLGTTDIPVRFFCPPEATLITLNGGV